MRDILPDLDRWIADRRPVALATVVQTWGSAPRTAGAKMALTPDGKITGSVSGGCVEAAVVEAGIEALKTNTPLLLHFGVTDETAWDVGLACGGSIDVFVKPLGVDSYRSQCDAWMDDLAAALVTVIRGPEGMPGRDMLVREDGRRTGSIGGEWDGRALMLAKEALSTGTSRRVSLNESIEVFAEAILPPPTLIAVGGVHIAVALAALAKTLGYRTVIVDPRRLWGNAERFPSVDQLIQAWPEAAFKQIRLTRSTAVAMLTHDPKLDDPALKIALTGPAFYVGALGSRTTHEKRRARLLEAGLSENELARLHAPIGLDIGAGTPEEIALAIMAEVVSARHRPSQPAEVALTAALPPSA